MGSEARRNLHRVAVTEQLRLSGDYPRLVARAVHKDRVLESYEWRNPPLESVA